MLGSSLLRLGFLWLRCTGFLLRWLLLLRSIGSRHMGFSSCNSRALEHSSPILNIRNLKKKKCYLIGIIIRKR